MTTIPEALAIAIEHHQAGRLQAAEQIYRQILQTDANQPDAYHLLGVMARDLGQSSVAIEFIGRAIQLRKNSAEYHYNLAGAYSDLKKHQEASALYLRSVELKPDFVEAHYNLGNAFKQLGRLDDALSCFHRSVQLRPDFVPAYFNLGVLLGENGKFDEAIQCYGRVLELQPDDFEALGNLGNLLKNQGKPDEAELCHRRTLQLNPNSAEAHHNLGQALMEQGKLTESIDCFRRSIELKPIFPEAHGNWGLALKKNGELDAAVDCYRRALEQKPEFPEVLNNLGNALNDLGRPQQAITMFQRALELKADDADTLNNLGNSLKMLSKFDDAASAYQRSLELKPNNPEAFSSLGDVFTSQGRLSDAVSCCQRSLELRPRYAAAHNNLACAYLYQGRPADAVISYRRAVDEKPDYAAAHSNSLLALQYRDGVTLRELYIAHAEFDRQHAASKFPKTLPVKIAKDCLRIGFVSADLGRHPVGLFLIGMFEHLAKMKIETICYSDRMVKDDLTDRFQILATQWHDVAGLNHERLAEQIRTDEIDILIDLAGHTSNNRLLVFARKPAPIQVTWLGYVGTTGLRAMDYILADRYLIPPEAEPFYCEKVLRLPDDYACYSTPSDAPDVGPLPAVRQGSVTFGSLNNLSKITPAVINLWSRILHRVPTSQLVIRYRGLDDAGTRNRFLELFTRQGISADRLQLLGFVPRATRLEIYNQIDIGLDPFPYSGATTTCDAMWMGVPVISCPLETFASRQSLTHLANVGLLEMVARDEDEYVNIAVGLANDLPRLAALRANLRKRMAASTLCDEQRFAHHFVDILKALWDQNG